MRDVDYRRAGRSADPVFEAVSSYADRNIPAFLSLLDEEAGLSAGDLDLIDSFAELSAGRRRAVLESAGDMLSARMQRTVTVE